MNDCFPQRISAGRARRTLAAGTATIGQVLWPAAAAGALVAVFAPLAALQYQRK